MRTARVRTLTALVPSLVRVWRTMSTVACSSWRWSVLLSRLTTFRASPCSATSLVLMVLPMRQSPRFTVVPHGTMWSGPSFSNLPTRRPATSFVDDGLSKRSASAPFFSSSLTLRCTSERKSPRCTLASLMSSESSWFQPPSVVMHTHTFAPDGTDSALSSFSVFVMTNGICGYICTCDMASQRSGQLVAYQPHACLPMAAW